MDPSRSAQDVLRCQRCETPVPPLCCSLCKIYLCKACAGEHILDESTDHRVVRIEQTLSNPVYPKCFKHTIKHCELYCKHCTIPICVQCVSSNEHQSHKFVDLLRLMEIKKEVIQTDLQELETSILTKYKEMASKIPIQRVYIRKTSQSLRTAIDEQGENLHKQVNAVVKKLKSKVGEKEEKQFSSLTEEEEEISQKISSIEECILKQKELQSSRDFCLINDYKSRNEDFRKLRPKHIVTLPTFSANKINTDQLLVQFGSLTIDTLRKPMSTEAVGKDLEKNISAPHTRHNSRDSPTSYRSMTGTYNRNGGESTPTRPHVPLVFQCEGKQYVSFGGRCYTYKQWEEMDRMFLPTRDSTDA